MDTHSSGIPWLGTKCTLLSILMIKYKSIIKYANESEITKQVNHLCFIELKHVFFTNLFYYDV